MLQLQPYYNQTIKNLISSFGSIFNDLQIIRTVNNVSKTINVPIAYASADKAFSRRVEDGDMNYNMKRVFPRMAFMMLGLEYDTERKLQPMQYTMKNVSSTTSIRQLQGVPYNIELELYIASSNIEDGLQIIEQILPFFTPEFMIRTKDFPTLNIMKDTPIVLTGVSYQDNTPDTEYTEDRDIQWTLSFTIKSYLYGPTATDKIIKEIKLWTFDMSTDPDIQLSTTTITAASGPTPIVAATVLEEPGATAP